MTTKHYVIQGASRGIGQAMVEQLVARGAEVTATCRTPPGSVSGARWLRLDLEDEESIEAAAEAVDGPVDVVINVAGLLHDGDLQPEKRLGHCQPGALARLFRVNAVGPLMVAKHFADRLADDAVFASLSARVGSIGDNNGLGGWYGYRASKAAQNMFTKNLSIELRRKHRGVKVVALHPGTVATDLSEPFRRHAKTVFSPERAARQLLGIVDELTPEDNGRFIAWDGSDIEW